MTSPLIVVCDWIPPEFGAVGQYQLASAQEEAAGGRNVTIIGLGRQNASARERIGAGELTTVRLARPAFEKGSIFKRAVWALWTNLAILRALAAAVRQSPDCEIKVTGSPPFLSYLVLMWARLVGRRRVIYRITDFYPETVFAAGKGPWLKPLTPLFHWLRRRADRIEALGGCQRQRLLESGVDPSRVHVVRDGSPVEFGSAIAAERPFGAEHTILLYSGNLGVAHDWRTFAEAYRRHVHEGPDRVRLWLNAAGTGVRPLLQFCAAHRLPIHHSQPAPLAALPGLLLAADAHLVLLGEPFWGYVLPSKIYACLESGRPCLYVGPAQSDLHALLLADRRNHSLRNDDCAGVARALASLAALAAPEPALDRT